jgi:hypothetical protein
MVPEPSSRKWTSLAFCGFPRSCDLPLTATGTAPGSRKGSMFRELFDCRARWPRAQEKHGEHAWMAVCAFREAELLEEARDVFRTTRCSPSVSNSRHPSLL